VGRDQPPFRQHRRVDQLGKTALPETRKKKDNHKRCQTQKAARCGWSYAMVSWGPPPHYLTIRERGEVGIRREALNAKHPELKGKVPLENLTE